MTGVFETPLTVAVNCCGCEALVIAAADGETEILTAGTVHVPC